MSLPASLPGVDLQPGKPPMLRTEATGDPQGWAASHRDALRAIVAEHGSVLVRGPGLSDPAQTGAIFRRLATALLVAMADPVLLAACSPAVEVTAR